MLPVAGNLNLSLYALLVTVSFLASLIGGVTGYGTGLLLLPIVGPQYVVPIVSLSALLTN